MHTDYERSLAFWTTSLYYLKLVEAVADQIALNGNKHIIVSDVEISPEEYYEKTKWSDHNISLPLLYNFCHVLELLLKGFVLLNDNTKNPNLDHDIEKLLDIFKSKYPSEKELITILEKYVSSNPNIEPLKSFFNNNKIKPSMFYQALRYPYDVKFNEFRHIDLKYRGSYCTNFYKELTNDITKLKQLSVALGRSLE